MRRAGGEAAYHLGHRHIVEHTNQFDVESARVGEAAEEQPSRINIVDPHTATAETALVDDALHGTTADKEFLKHACVQFVEVVACGDFRHRSGISMSLHRIGTPGAVAPDNGLHHLADKIIGHGTAAGIEQHIVLAAQASVGVESQVAPLVAVSEVLETRAALAESGCGLPCRTCGSQ